MKSLAGGWLAQSLKNHAWIISECYRRLWGATSRKLDTFSKLDTFLIDTLVKICHQTRQKKTLKITLKVLLISSVAGPLN